MYACVPVLYKKKWQPQNSLTQHTHITYPFHFGYLPLTRGLTQSFSLWAHAHKHKLTNCGHVDSKFRSTALPNMLSFIMVAAVMAPAPPCYSLWSLGRLFCWSLLTLLTFSPPHRETQKYEVWQLTSIVYFFRFIEPKECALHCLTPGTTHLWR